MPNANFDVLAHIEDMGDIHAGPGEYAGTRGKKKFMEGFSITLKTPLEGAGLRYRAHVSGSGNTPWVKDGAFVGSRGARKAIEGFWIELSGVNLAHYDVQYMTHVRDVGDSAWVSNGAYVGTQGQNRPVEGLAVKIVPRVHNYVSIISKANSGSGKTLLITANPNDTSVQVSAPTGSDLQLWDKRPVKAGDGYALISKARPNLCIARGPGQPIVLKETRLIDTDDTCVWRDDRVPPPFNAITSWTDWEMKLNMSGNPPYADKDNRLIIYQWSAGAPNELWRMNKASYNIIAGTDDRALNTVSEAIYRGCYPQVFKGSLPIGQLGIKSVGYDILSVPQFNLQPSVQLQQGFLKRMSERFGTDDQALAIAAEAAASTVNVRVDSIKLIIDGDKPVSVDASLQIGASVQANPDRSITLRLKLGDLKIPAHPELEPALNQVFVPLLLEVLNKTVLDHIAVPALDLLGIQFTAPVIATRLPHLLVAASKLPDSAMLPPGGSWPDKKVFVGADEAVLNAVGTAALEKLKPSGDWRDVIDIFICDLKLEAHYEMTLRNPRFTVTATSGNKCKVSIDLGGYARFRATCAGASAAPGAGARGRVDATASVTVSASNKIIVTFLSLDYIDLDWSFDGLPVWMDAVISKILGALNPAVKAVVTAALKGKEFEVYTVPTIDAKIAGKTFEIRFKDLVLDSGADVDKKAVVLVTGAADIRIK